MINPYKLLDIIILFYNFVLRYTDSLLPNMIYLPILDIKQVRLCQENVKFSTILN